MHTDRRDFIRLSASTLAVTALGGTLLSAAHADEPKPAPAKPAPAGPGLKILILGGTEFLGPALINAAKARGHSVTLFNRGKREKRKPGRFEQEDKLVGNRDPQKHALTKFADGKEIDDTDSPKGLAQIEQAIKAGRTWDAVIDTSGYFPRHVKASAELLAPVIKHYIFISTVSVYAGNDKPDSDESAPLGTMPDPTVEDMGPGSQFYGPLKALCEKAAEATLPGRVTSIRPGFIVGPDDGSDRFTYWPWRASQGGDMLAPGSPTDPVQFIDVRDLAAWAIRCIENKTFGTFNATGGLTPHKWGDVLDACVKASPKPATPTKLIWTDADTLATNGIPPGALPIWLPPTGETAGFHRVNCQRAIKAGLTFRPVSETVTDVMAWLPTEFARRAKVTQDLKDEAKAAGRPEPRVADPAKLRAGLSLDQEKQLLAQLKAPAPAADPAPAPAGKGG